MQPEIWKDIQGYEGKYQVSNLGRVFAKKIFGKAWGGKCRKKQHIMKDACNGRGYRYITISIDRVRKNHYVHRLVADAFLEKSLFTIEVNHKNGNKADNRLDNLEWVTSSENRQHAVKTGLMPTRGNHSFALKVTDHNTGKEFECIKDAADAYGMNYGTLKDALTRNKVYKGLEKINKTA